MVQRAPRASALIALLLTFTLVAAACGSDDGGGDGVASSEAGVDDPAVEEVVAAAVRYVDELGGEAAFAAVIIALDRGYDADQLISPDATLTADGEVDGVEPAGQPLGATTATDSGGASTDDATSDDEGAVPAPTVQVVAVGAEPPVPVDLAQADVDGTDGGSDAPDPTEVGLLGLELTLGEVHQQAVEEAYLEEMFGDDFVPPAEDGGSGADASADDVRLLFTILALSSRGYDVEQITLALATGTVDANPPPCPYIVGELPTRSTDTFERVCPEILDETEDATAEDDGGTGGSGADDSSDDGSGQADGDGSSDAGTALGGIEPGSYQGTIDTAGAFRDGVEVTTADITLTVEGDGAAVDWTVEWSELNVDCITTGVDWFSGDEITQDTPTSFSIRGNRAFRPGADSTCDLGAEPSDIERTFRFDIDGSTVKSDVGVGLATIDVG